MADKPVPGDKVGTSILRRAAFVSDLVDVRNAHKRHAIGDPPRRFPLSTPTDLVKVKNLTGADRVRGAVVQIGDGLLDDVKYRALWLEGNAVAYPACTRYAILRQPIKEDIIGFAQVSGVCTALVRVLHVDHRYAMPTEGLYVLHSCAIGPIEILSDVDGTDGEGESQELIVRLCIQGHWSYAVANEEITARSTTTCGVGEVTFWKKSASRVLSATTMVEDAANWTGTAIESGSLLRVERDISGVLTVVGQDCSGVALS